jgi:hypothetical protein
MEIEMPMSGKVLATVLLGRCDAYPTSNGVNEQQERSPNDSYQETVATPAKKPSEHASA